MSVDIRPYTGLHFITNYIANCRCALFGHIARLSEAVPANQALHGHDDAWGGGGHHNPRGNLELVAHSTAGWRKADTILTLLQLTCDV